MDKVPALRDEPVIEGEYREVPSISEQASRALRRTGRAIGKGVSEVGRQLGAAAGGFKEGLRERPRTPGRGAREVGRALGRISFRGEDYWWGTKEEKRTITKPRTPRSNLPKYTQVQIVDLLSGYYPSIYNYLWHRGINYSEFVGRLRDEFPNTYWELRDETG